MSNGFNKMVSQLDKEKMVLVYCASGGRSRSAMKKMKDMGFKTIYNLSGGFNAWKNKGYDITP